jgi:hypothetical protein
VNDYFRRSTELSAEDQQAVHDNDPFFWEDYIGTSEGMCHFRHGSYRIIDIVNARYPDPEDPRRTMLLLKFSGTT